MNVSAGVSDEPRWVEASAILADPSHWTRPAGAGYVLGHDASSLLIALGDADASAVARIATERAGWSLLAASERTDIRDALAAHGWRVEAAHIATLPDPSLLPDHDGAALLPRDADLAHLPPALAAEIAAALAHGDVWTAVVDGVAVCFGHAPWRSARWFDVSIDTLPEFRQLGLATRVAAALIRSERARGREPVWGAVESNAASLRLSQRLGFVIVDALWVATSL